MPDPFAPAGRAPQDHDRGPVFIASFTSECAGCDGAIFEGDEARMIDGEAYHEDEECQS
jgi:hypothetical protein